MKKFWSLLLVLLLASLSYADITPLPDPPSRTEPSTFAAKADAFLGALPDFALEANQLAADVNDDEVAAAASAAAALGYSNIALSSANFAGDWDDQAGAAAPPYSVWHAGNYWQLANAVLDVSATEPGQTADWRVIGDKLTVSTIADLRLISCVGISSAYLIGYTSPEDGGQGVFYWDAASVLSDNGGTIIAVTGVATGRWIRQLNGFVTPGMFGADKTGAVDCTAALEAVRLYAYTNKVKVIFPQGTYTYTTSPNWGFEDCDIEAVGKVILKHTGTGNGFIFDAGATVATVFNVRCVGNFVVESDGANGIFVRSIHHSKINARVRGCQPTGAGLVVNFAVASEFNVVVSVNEGGFVSGRTPLNGYVLTSRATGETVTDCTFNNPIIEGVTGDGIVLDRVLTTTFIGGTSEANGGVGISLTANASGNTFQGIDLEGNAGGDFTIAGRNNTLLACYSDSTTTVTGKGNSIIKGSYNSIVDNGTDTMLLGCEFGLDGGTISGTQVGQSRQQVRSITGGSLVADKKANSIGPIIVSCATVTPTAAITLPSTKNNLYRVFAYYANSGNAKVWSAYALISQDLTTNKILEQFNGSLLTITIAGQVVTVTQASGATLNITVIAEALF